VTAEYHRALVLLAMWSQGAGYGGVCQRCLHRRDTHHEDCPVPGTVELFATVDPDVLEAVFEEGRCR
jgi:hypothetical protein